MKAKEEIIKQVKEELIEGNELTIFIPLKDGYDMVFSTLNHIRINADIWNVDIPFVYNGEEVKADSNFDSNLSIAIDKLMQYAKGEGII